MGYPPMALKESKDKENKTLISLKIIQQKQLHCKQLTYI